ncbi:type I secretion system permease/ATPase [Sulfitobacter pontiacus]|uniref:type I secretion system permease/ATPase n=2 Tax=Sulfitobacter pontiacus TaxID=60137 RepID=UPI002AC1D269|nr:ATP-binding cassette domain-containing protein [Sulfitobacter pontiacus]
MQTHNIYAAALRSQLGGIGLLFVVSGLINILLLTGSIYMIQIYDRVLPSGSVVTLMGLFGIVLLLYCFFGLFDLIRQRLLARLSVRLDLALGAECFAAWVSNDEKNNVPASAQEPLQQLGHLRRLLSSPAFISVCDMPFVPIFLLALYIIHPWLGAMVLGGAALACAVMATGRYLTRNTISISANQDHTLADMSYHSRRLAEPLRAMRMQVDLATYWRGLQRSSLAWHQRLHAPPDALASFSKSFRLMLQSAILTVGAILVIQGQISAGMIMAASILAGRVLAPIDQMISGWRGIACGWSAHRHLHRHFSQNIPAREGVALPEPKGRISFTAVSHGIEGGAENGLKDISFDLSPGDGLCVLGGPNAGKSILAKLAVGVAAPTTGEVRFDAVNLARWPSAQIGPAIGYLPDTIDLLPATIFDNISRFRPDTTDAKVIAAAKLARVHHAIMALPDGYMSVVRGGGGSSLTQGQIQQIGLARALVCNPVLVVMDDPLRSLFSCPDAEQIVAEVARHMRDRGSTVVITARQPCVISALNKVLILSEGRIRQFGLTSDIFGRAFPTRVAAKVQTLPILGNGTTRASGG